MAKTNLLKKIFSPVSQFKTNPEISGGKLAKFEDLKSPCPEFKTILGNITEGIIVTDKSGKIIVMNDQAEALLGLRFQKAIGEKLDKNIIIEKEKGYYISLEKLFAKLEYLPGKKLNTTVHVIERNKTKLPVLAKITPVFQNGQRIGAVVLIPNSPKEEEEEEEVDEVNTEFLSRAAHQLRTPLGSMRWAIEILLDGDTGKLPKETQKILEQIYQSNHLMINLVNDLLNVSRIDQGRAENKPQLINYIDVLKAVTNEMEFQSEKRSVTLDLDINNDTNPMIMLDPKRFRDIIQNLLVNAIKYSYPKGNVKIKVEELQNQLQISITDSGIGIPIKDQGMIFSRFFRADNALKTREEGTGLGLYMVRSYVEAAGGNVWFESKEGKGTTFYLDFPLSETQVPEKT